MGATATRPVLPGVYPTFQAARRTALPPSYGAVVAVPIVHTDGPVGQPDYFTSFSDWEQAYGADDSPGRIAVHGAFNGEGLEGFGGAQAVLVSRVAGAAAAQADVTLDNPAAADAITVAAAYPGTRGNRLSIQVLPVVGGVQEVLLLDGTVEVENWTYTINQPGALAGLVALMNASDLINDSAVVLEGVTGLAAGTFPLTGGNDGLVLTGADWTAAIAQFEFFDFAVFAPYDLPWAQGVGAQSIRDTIAAIVAWRDQQEAQGHRFMVAVGGALDELPADAIARAQSLSNPSVITVGGPGFNDDQFGALSSSQLAPRIAGIRAQRGESMSMDMARLAGGTPRPLVTGGQITLSNVVDMVQAGVITLQRDRWQVAPTRIAKDVNTYQPVVADPLNEPEGKPLAIYGTPKFVMAMQQFANQAQAELERTMIGKVIVNDATRAAAAARVLGMAKDRERIGSFAPGTVVTPVPGDDTDDFITIQVDLTFGRALAQLFIQATVR